MNIDRVHQPAVLMLLIAGLAASATAAAEELAKEFQTPHAQWSLFAGANHTDNATLLPNGPSDTIVSAGLGGSVYRDTGRLRVDFDGSAHYEDYVDHTFGGQWLGNLVGLGSYAFIPERFIWVLQDALGQVNANTLLPTTPANRINANIFSTGPDGYLRFAGDTGLLLGARFGQSNFQTGPNAPVDDQRVSGNIGLIQRVSRGTALSLNANASRIEYRVPGHPSFDQQELFARFETKSARGGLSLDLGTSKLSEDSGSVRDPLARVAIVQQLTASWNFNLSASREFRNSTTSLQSLLTASQVVNGQVLPTGPGLGPPGAGGVTADVILSQSAFRSSDGRVALDFVRPRTLFDVYGSVARQRYYFSATGYDRDLRDWGASFTRLLSPSLTFRVAASHDRRKQLASTLPGDRTQLADAGFDWRMGTMLTTTLAYHREDRTADPGGISYLVNRVYLGFTYGAPKPGIAFRPLGREALGPVGMRP